MNAKQAKKRAAFLLSTAPGGANASRLLLLSKILQSHPNARLEVCLTLTTQAQAAKRAGRCAKIGRSTYNYQLWAVWA